MPLITLGEIRVPHRTDRFPGASDRTATQGFALVHAADYGLMAGPFATAQDAAARAEFAPAALIVACEITTA
jgi:hypothetical protein